MFNHFDIHLSFHLYLLIEGELIEAVPYTRCGLREWARGV